MTETEDIEKIFQDATHYLNPVLKKAELEKHRGKSLIEILATPDTSSDDQRIEVIQKVADFLGQIHQAYADLADEEKANAAAGRLTQSSQDDKKKQNEALEDAKRRRIIHALLDLISLEAIYPGLSSGVGIPLQQRVLSVLPPGVVAQQAPNTNIELSAATREALRIAADGLNNIICSSRSGIQVIARNRSLTDILCADAELAFDPVKSESQDRQSYERYFEIILKDTPTFVLLPLLTSLATPAAPEWLKVPLSLQRANIPLREDGVEQIIVFIASQIGASTSMGENEQLSAGPTVSVKAIMHCSKLLSAVPQTMNAKTYFETIAPQLLRLLDGEDDALRKAAAYIIGSGILGKRAYGAPGTIGHTIFVKPLFDALTAQNIVRPNAADDILVTDTQLEIAISRLCTLTLQHPHPGLTNRLVQPVLLPLWGILCFAKESSKAWWYEKCSALLNTFFKLSAAAAPLLKIADKLLWDGEPTWKFAPGHNGGIESRRRPDEDSIGFNIITGMQSMDLRIEEFVKLLGPDGEGEERTGDIFLQVSKKWLVHTPNSSDDSKIKSLGPENDLDSSLQTIFNAKLAQKLLQTFQKTLSSRPLHILQLLEQIIGNALNESKRVEIEKSNASKATLSSLGNIVSNDESTEDSAEAEAKPYEESLSVAFSFLSTLLASPDFDPLAESATNVLQTLESQLKELIPTLKSPLLQPATTSSMLLEIHLHNPESKPKESGVEDKARSRNATDLETHRTALSQISDPLPPIRAEGLSKLSSLISTGSPVLDITATLALLISLLTDDDDSDVGNENSNKTADSYTYLNAIKLIVLLSHRHPKTAVKTLLETYIDDDESSSLNTRLRIGEALLKIVEDATTSEHGNGTHLDYTTTQSLADAMIKVASRRPIKGKAKASRDRAIRKEHKDREKKRKQEEELFGGPAPNLREMEKEIRAERGIKDEDDENEDSEEESPEQNEWANSILRGWAAGSGSALEKSKGDDLRIRTSALSILSALIAPQQIGGGYVMASQTQTLPPNTLSELLTSCLHILTLETDPSATILRRAAAMSIYSLIKHVDATSSTTRSQTINSSTTARKSNFTFQEEEIVDVLRVLGYLDTTERDEIVRGHLSVVREGLEAWIAKSAIRAVAGDEVGDDDGSGGIRFDLGLDNRGGVLRGLEVDPFTARGAGEGVKGRIIEEIE